MLTQNAICTPPSLICAEVNEIIVPETCAGTTQEAHPADLRVIGCEIKCWFWRTDLNMDQQSLFVRLYHRATETG